MPLDIFHNIAGPTGRTLDMRIETPFVASATITVISVPTSGQVLRANGTEVSQGDSLTATELAGLRYETGQQAGSGELRYRVDTGTETLDGRALA